jgi:hypothetical protein
MVLATPTGPSLRASRSVSSCNLALKATRLFLARYESPTTKFPELIFSALLSDDGARDVRFERVLRT